MWLNRKEAPLPKESCIMWVKFDKHVQLCRWYPFDINNYYADTMPAEGYIGTARVIDGQYVGIGYHVWKQNDSEFLEYQLIDTPTHLG